MRAPAGRDDGQTHGHGFHDVGRSGAAVTGHDECIGGAVEHGHVFGRQAMRQEKDRRQLDQVVPFGLQVADDFLLDSSAVSTDGDIRFHDQVDRIADLERTAVSIKELLPGMRVIPIEDSDKIKFVETIEGQRLDLTIRAEGFRINRAVEDTNAIGGDAFVPEHLAVVVAGHPDLIEVPALLGPVLRQAIGRPVEPCDVGTGGGVELVDVRRRHIPQVNIILPGHAAAGEALDAVAAFVA